MPRATRTVDTTKSVTVAGTTGVTINAQPVVTNPIVEEAHPEPVVVQQPEPVVVQQPEPVVVKEPEPVVVKQPEPVVVKQPEPVKVETKKEETTKKTETKTIEQPKPSTTKTVVSGVKTTAVKTEPKKPSVAKSGEISGGGKGRRTVRKTKSKELTPEQKEKCIKLCTLLCCCCYKLCQSTEEEQTNTVVVVQNQTTPYQPQNQVYQPGQNQVYIVNSQQQPQNLGYNNQVIYSNQAGYTSGNPRHGY